MRRDPRTAEELLSNLRMIYGTLLFCVPLYAYVMQTGPALPSPPAAALSWGMGLLTVVDLSVAATIRKRKLEKAFETLSKVRDDPEALSLWRVGSLIGGACAMAAVLFGVVLHYLGAPIRQVVPFFVAGTAALLAWWPRRPNA